VTIFEANAFFSAFSSWPRLKRAVSVNSIYQYGLGGCGRGATVVSLGVMGHAFSALLRQSGEATDAS
jgi:hypothetical protein